MKVIHLTQFHSPNTFGPGVAVLLDRLVAIKDGNFDQEGNRFRATLVLSGGVEISVCETVDEVLIQSAEVMGEGSRACPVCVDPQA